MHFATRCQTLAQSRSTNPALLRVSICAAGLFVWTLLCSYTLGDSKGEPLSKPARVKVVVEAQGDLTLAAEKEGQPDPKPVPMQVIANLTYDEVSVSTDSSARTARYYHEAKAQLSVAKRPIENRLRADRRYVFCDSTDGKTSIYSSTGALSRNELELLTVPANSMVIDQLLPVDLRSDSEPKQGHKWTQEAGTVAALLNLHAVTTSDVSSVIAEADDKLVRMRIAGQVSGSVDGVITELEIKGKYNFDREAKRITWLAMTIKETRAVGPTTPGFTVEARVRVAIEPAIDSTFTDQTVETSVVGSQAGLQVLELEPQDSTFAITLGRNWHLLSESPHVAVIRMVSNGQTVAQCNLRELPTTGQAKPVTLDSFKLDAMKGLTDASPQILSATESTNPSGLKVYRVQVAGTVGNAAVQWIYHLAIGEDGRGVSYVFTMAADQAEQFGAADHEITSSLRFRETTKEDVRMVELDVEALKR
ncbi:MAG: hypothetical protein KDB27_17935 [Planctomycetales bacterium]|nr:hypothetical protein [Planctomycetales bacterium]